MILCTFCDGFGKHFTRPILKDDEVKVYEIKCELCDGTGLIADGKIDWKLKGRKMRDYRVWQMGMGLREAERYLGIDASNLSKMERGIIKPKNLWAKG